MTLPWRASLFFALLLLTGNALGTAVWVVGDPGNAYHQEFMESLRRENLPRETELIFRTVDDAARPERPDLIVTLGDKAAAREAEGTGVVLHAFITQDQFFALHPRGSGKGHSAIFLEQPLERYVALVHAALPRVSRLLVPLGDPSRADLSALQQAANRFGITVRAEPVVSAGAMDELLARADRTNDALLFLPDPSLRSNAVMKVAVVGAYRRQLPLVAYSEGLVKAGALMSVHSTVPLLARQVAESIGHYSSEHRLAPPAYPARFDLAVNYELANSLGLHIADKPQLTRQVKEMLVEVAQ